MNAASASPISIVLNLQPCTQPPEVVDALGQWIRTTHDVALESAEFETLVVDWRFLADDLSVCQLVAVDSYAQVRRGVTVFWDEAGAVALLEESPLLVADTPHVVVDLSAPMQQLLRALAPMTVNPLGLSRSSVSDFDTLTAESLAALQEDFAPGVLVAVTAEDDAPLTATQSALVDSLLGLALLARSPERAPVLGELGLTGTPRSGCLISITRTATGLDARMIPSTSLRTRPDSARRLLVRRHLAVPLPFDLERRRSVAVARVLGGGQEVDLPTAMQLLEEEGERTSELRQRVNELEGLLELAYEEQDAALRELDDTQSQLRFLQKAFRELGELPLVEAEEDEDWRPESCSDALVAARESLPFLTIGQTERACEVLDAQQKRGIWAKKIWSALRALNDYCRVKAEGRFSGDMAMYRDNPPTGVMPLLADYAPAESESTGNDAQLRASRTFAVPTIVNSAGHIYMQQHLKIDRGGRSAPRVHLYDDSGGGTQRIYVGYIGPHLPTSSGF